MDKVMNILEIDQVGIKFKLRKRKTTTLKESVLNFFYQKRGSQEFWALNNISFKLKRGESLGIIGANGAGKTTLLRILAGIYFPDAGRVSIKGRLSALIELGAGFNEELTGRENIYLNGSILGLSRKWIDNIINEIVNFSELEEFIDVPLKNYSSGMKLRLGFSIAINVNPDILLVDEVLAVGDAAFQQKCFRKMRDFQQLGMSFIIVSHDLSTISSFCHRTLLLQNGEQQGIGSPEKIISQYMKSLHDRKDQIHLSIGKLKILFRQGIMSIYWRNYEITKKDGVHTSLLNRGAWQGSKDANWEIIESSEDSFTAEGSFLKIPLKQIWIIKISEQAIRWQIKIEALMPLRIDEHYAGIMLSDGYKNWFTSANKGVFSSIEQDQRFWKEVSPVKPGLKKVGVEANYNEIVSLPSISFCTDTLENGLFAKALNTDYSFFARILQFLKINTSEKAIISSERKDFFSGTIFIKT
jgi:ABC-type polysaccharide/polyol phosphate transport system ATPase subunit